MGTKNKLLYATLYKSDKLSDVKFVLRDKNDRVTKIPAQRLALSLHSEVFERMFDGEMKDDGSIKIIDASPDGFAEFLQLFYLSEVKLSKVNIGEELRLIDKYDAREFLGHVREVHVGHADEAVCLVRFVG